MGEILDAKKTDLELTQFATLSAIKGSQFGKDVYSSAIKFNDLADFLEIFPEVQRDIVPRKVNMIKRYILSGVENPDETNMRFFSAVTVTAKGTLYYDEKNHRCAIDTYNSKLSINDGQHRFEAVKQSIVSLEKMFLKSKDKYKSARLRRMINDLKDMVIPIVIFDDLSDREEKQLFHDLNNLASRPSRNSNIRLNQTDIFSKMSRDLAKENRYLNHYGVEMDKMSISGHNNKNTVLLSTLYAMTKELLGLEYRHNHNVLTKENYDEVKKMLNETLNSLFFALPNDLNTRGKYITEKSFVMKAIVRFIHHARTHIDLQLKDEEIFKIIGDMDWTYNIKVWEKYGAALVNNDTNILFAGGATANTKTIYNHLMGIALDVAESKEKESKKKTKVKS